MTRAVLVIRPSDRSKKMIRVALANEEERAAYLASIGAPADDNGYKAPWGFDRGVLSAIQPDNTARWFPLANIDAFWIEHEEAPDA